MKKVADRPLGGKYEEGQKVDRTGSYAIFVSPCFADGSRRSNASVSASITLGKKCDVGARAVGDVAGARVRRGEPSPSRCLKIGGRCAGGSAAIKPRRNDVRDRSARARNRNPIACSPGGRARRAAHRSALGVAQGGVPTLRVVSVGADVVRHVSAVRRASGGAS